MNRIQINNRIQIINELTCWMIHARSLITFGSDRSSLSGMPFMYWWWTFPPVCEFVDFFLPICSDWVRWAGHPSAIRCQSFSGSECETSGTETAAVVGFVGAKLMNRKVSARQFFEEDILKIELWGSTFTEIPGWDWWLVTSRIPVRGWRSWILADVPKQRSSFWAT